MILGDEEPTIMKRKFVALCEELVKRKLPLRWDINTRVTDVLRDRDLLPLYRKAGLVHASLGTEAGPPSSIWTSFASKRDGGAKQAGG